LVCGHSILSRILPETWYASTSIPLVPSSSGFISLD
jgi:hypothetical protein